MAHCRQFGPLLRGLAVGGAFAALAGSAVAQPPSGAVVQNVETALNALPEAARNVAIAVGKLDLPRGGHLQGIQVRSEGEKDFVLMSHDSLTEGYLVIAEFESGLRGEGKVVGTVKFPSDGQSPPLRHAGGFQIAGDVLAIGLEDNQLKTRSEVQFWTVADPRKPVQLAHLTVRRKGAAKDQTAGGVALVADDQQHLLAVANWDSRAIDFYESLPMTLTDPDCRFQHHARWQAETADTINWKPDTRFGTYQAINFIRQMDGRLDLVGFDTRPDGADLVDLFAVLPRKSGVRQLQKVASKTLRLGADNHFRFAGGAALIDGRLTVLASPRTLSEKITLSVAP